MGVKHLVWQCSYHTERLPEEWTQMIAANENAMLWARGLIELPAYHPIQGVDSCEVGGIFTHGWPVRIGPHQRLAIGVQATSKDKRLRKFAVAVVATQWQDGGWQLIGHCTALAPGPGTEARAWFFGCWLTLQMVLGRHQLNIPHHGGWAAIRKGAQGKVAPDLWHHLPEEEWSRLQLVQVPWKLLKNQQEDVRGKKQYIMAKEVAARRANLERPTSPENELKVEDQLHFEVYQVAGQRIGAILQDKHHYSLHEWQAGASAGAHHLQSQVQPQRGKS